MHIGTNICGSVVDFCENRAVVVADPALKDFVASLPFEVVFIPSGEAAKTAEAATTLQHTLFLMGCDRETTLIALGGGATTDLVGFVASILFRGVPLVLIPTTLLAMVDAAIGGKTGINTSFGKNLLGATYFPKKIFIDFQFLKTLPEKELFNGYAEIIKLGLVWDASLLEANESERIHKAIRGKLEIVEQDPFDASLRRILNFGHTIGHGLERALDFSMSHGEAVAIGCLTESYLSRQLGYLSEKDFEQICSFYPPLRLPESYCRQRLFQAMASDKKRSSGNVRFVLIDAIGHALSFEGQYCRAVPEESLLQALAWMERYCG
ncbi:MAG: 3-dehydroquinate synthase family protein [Chlamydiales bacterium]|nr:3-dehydroquinate synthase family protein [Chlamydiales bacterium]